MLSSALKPVASPEVVLREEFDDWALLFVPDTGVAYGLNPTGVFIWKSMDGEHSIGSIAEALRETFTEPAEDLEAHVAEFVETLQGYTLVGFQAES
jgi:SynChlorMet cassette protein ScmD